VPIDDFARHLVETGVCKDTNEVFRRFLVEGKPGYVPHRWASLRDAIQWITAAGGMAIIAHPATKIAMSTNWWGIGGKELHPIASRLTDEEIVTRVCAGEVDLFELLMPTSIGPHDACNEVRKGVHHV